MHSQRQLTSLHSVMHSHPNVQWAQALTAPMHTKIHIYNTLSQTLAAGMAMCTNTPTFTHPLNLYTQKPRLTTSLSAVKPRNYTKPLSVFIHPFLTMHYPHHLPCSHLPSNLGWSHFFLSHMIDNPEIRALLTYHYHAPLCTLSVLNPTACALPSCIEKVKVRVCNHANRCVFTIYNQLRL